MKFENFSDVPFVFVGSSCCHITSVIWATKELYLFINFYGSGYLIK
jgi:hypothetical protein